MESWAIDGRLRSLGRDRDSADYGRIVLHVEPAAVPIFGLTHAMPPARLAGLVCRGVLRMARDRLSVEQRP